MRVAEIYLINAEAKAHLNDPDAINKLNDLKTARGAKTINTNLSQQDLLETIWLERTFIGEIEETMSLSLFLKCVSLSVLISVNIVNGTFGICFSNYSLLVADKNLYKDHPKLPIYTE